MISILEYIKHYEALESKAIIFMKIFNDTMFPHLKDEKIPEEMTLKYVENNWEEMYKVTFFDHVYHNMNYYFLNMLHIHIAFNPNNEVINYKEACNDFYSTFNENKYLNIDFYKKFNKIRNEKNKAILQQFFITPFFVNEIFNKEPIYLEENDILRGYIQKHENLINYVRKIINIIIDKECSKIFFCSISGKCTKIIDFRILKINIECYNYY
ncbi:hypothetical protein Mgra_00006547 [Meloidogyne graminicola]|uniref:Uncharacterized protein n=1 Tax=Meloidogyne graminicola TaxID=189291 RepID=A0A8S9ZL56_9BILA|nr:hypothetical protein Mgra_00006547 [Meloidogyne graminicola]